MKIKLSELYKTDFNISNIFAVNQMWQDRFTFTMSDPRPTDALLLFCGCDGLLKNFATGNETLYPSGSLVHIPKSLTYSWTFLKRTEDVSSKLIEFVPTDAKGEYIELGNTITKIEQPYPCAYTRFFDSIINEYSKPVHAYAKIKALTYDFLYEISVSLRKESYYGAECIYKGIKYLEDDPVQDKSIKDIAAMCNVSVNYFERLFKGYAGCTPSEYRLKKKAEKAKLLIEGNYMSIEQTAFELGFSDSAYFCRLFKKYTGMTPTQYRNTKKNLPRT